MDERDEVKMGTRAAADYLGLTQKTMEDYRYKKTGPKFTKRPNGICEYTQADLDNWIATLRDRHVAA